MKSQAYSAAGVNLEVAAAVKEVIKQLASKTYKPQVISGVGPFAGLFKLEGYAEPTLVSSVDGVGTKLKIACLLNKHDTVGVDLVHHSVNDILCSGAEPLFFLDYIAMGKLIPRIVENIIQGMVRTCQDLGLALLGGETAEMPGYCPEGDYELVGFILGVVEKEGIIDGKNILSGDKILALPSSGLHTNGYSLVRKAFALDRDTSILKRYYPELGKSLGEELMTPHRCYYPELKPFLRPIKGIAHITGGGILDNLPRILPPGLAARIRKGACPVPPIFPLIQKEGRVAEGEMYHVFNMGMGMVVVVSPDKVELLKKGLPQVYEVGEIVIQKERRVIIN